VQLRDYLEARYPELRGNITGGHHPAPPIADLLSNIVAILQVLGLTSVFLGDAIFRFVPFVKETPQWYHQLRENPMGAILFVFFILPSIAQSFSASGAFEIILDGVTIYSKLETGQMPTGPHVLHALKMHGITME